MQPLFMMEWSHTNHSSYSDTNIDNTDINFIRPCPISLHIYSNMDSSIQNRWHKILPAPYNIDLSKQIEKIKPQKWQSN